MQRHLATIFKKLKFDKELHNQFGLPNQTTFLVKCKTLLPLFENKQKKHGLNFKNRSLLPQSAQVSFAYYLHSSF